ncbi:MAG: M48 family metallopeptidase [Cyclobacteriaceae bacterium]|nr:M48 family metallopeptidase [Cyclobacteriaceae bacterium]
MKPEFLLVLYIIIISAEFLFEKILGILNYRNLENVVPERMKGIYDPEKYKKSIAYNKENARFGFLTSTISFIVVVILIATGFFGMLDGWVRGFTGNPILVSLLFFGILYVAADILSTPFAVYDTFVIEEKYGFNKTTPRTFIIDKLKGYLLSIILGGGILFVLLILINRMGEDFWIYFWIVISGFTLFMNVFYTDLIVPLFNKLIPLEENELKKAIFGYSRKVNFPLDNIFVIDGSRRSTKANAYFSGLGKKKKIVLFDTLINNHSIEELVAVLAHEVGHYKKKHIIQTYFASILQTGIILFIMSLMIFNPDLSMAFGGEQLAIHLNLIAFFILFSPISTLTGILMNMISRKNEYQADAYAAETYQAGPLQEALKKLSTHNLGNLTPHPWYVFVNYSHPPLLSRLKALDHFKPVGDR